MNHTPKFLLASDADRASWREIPQTKDFMDYLDWEESRCADGILSAVRQGHPKEAEILSGKLEAIQELIKVMWYREQPKEAPDEPFVDPAALWSKHA
jgi:hypothetical protein